MSVLAIDPGVTIGWAFIEQGEFMPRIFDGQGLYQTFFKLIRTDGTFLHLLHLMYLEGEIECVVEETPTIGLGALSQTLSSVRVTIDQLFPNHSVILPGTWKNSLWARSEFTTATGKHASDAGKMGLYWLHKEEKS